MIGVLDGRWVKANYPEKDEKVINLKADEIM